MNKNYKTIILRNDSTMNEKTAEWFHNKWHIPAETYLESIRECQQTKVKIPQWNIIIDKENCNKIIAGMGVIDNDFHERRDLSPNICAVFTESDYRGMGLAKYLLDFVCKDMSALGYNDLYLITSHTEFYEKCGWEFFCNVKEDNGETARVYRHMTEKTCK